jgi:hypothetical protein
MDAVDAEILRIGRTREQTVALHPIEQAGHGRGLQAGAPTEIHDLEAILTPQREEHSEVRGPHVVDTGLAQLLPESGCHEQGRSGDQVVGTVGRLGKRGHS